MRAYTLPSQTVFNVVCRPWPGTLPHPVALNAAETVWLSVVPDICQARAYHEAWRAAGYSGLIYLPQLQHWRPYRRGWYVRSGASLHAACGHVGLPSLASRLGLRLAAGLHRVASTLAQACRWYERRRLMRRARRVLAERSR